MKLFVVFAAAVALAGATELGKSTSGNADLQGRVVSNEILRTNRRLFASGWGSSSGAGAPAESTGYRPGPPPGLDGGLMNLFNAMSNFGLSSSYGAPAAGGGSGRPPAARPPSQQYGPPASGGPSGGGNGGRPPKPQYGPPPASGGPPSSEYGPPASGGGGGPPSSEYGPPASGGAGGPPSSEYGAPLAGGNGLRLAEPNVGLPGPVGVPRIRGNGAAPGGRSAAGPAGSPEGGRIFRFVSLFTAPDDPAPPRPKIIRAGPRTPDRHVNIIFVRPPTPAAEQPTEVILSPEPERKTIVYVLMKKPVEGQDNVRVRQPAATPPSKPEVFFIPYSDPASQQSGGNGIGDEGAGGYNDGPNGDIGGPAEGGPGGYDAPGNGNGGLRSGGPSGGYNNGPAAGGPSGGYNTGPAAGGPSGSNGGYSNGAAGGPNSPLLLTMAVPGLGGYD